MGGPLEGVKVLDLTRVLAGPYCTMLLCDMGAEVIKIERPNVGEDSRYFSPFKNGESGYYIFLNRGKKSLTLNLKKPEGVEIFKKLTAKADVIVENFKPGTLEKLGIGYDMVREINPRIIMASISGFGQTGPYAQRPAYDIVAQAMGGIMSITGSPDGPPMRVGSSLGDMSAGVLAAFGILVALFWREKSGVGQHVDVSMMDSIFAFLESNVVRYTFEGIVPTRIGSRHPISAPFDVYRAKDGWVVIAVANEALFERFCQAIGRPELVKDDRFSSDPNRVAHESELKSIIEAWSKNYTVQEVVDKLLRYSIPSSPILGIDEVCHHPQIEARNMLVELDHPVAGKVKIPGQPVKLSMSPGRPRGPSPLLGQHTTEILVQYLGYTEEQIHELKEKEIL